MAQNRDKRGEMGAQDDLDEHTVFINRCATASARFAAPGFSYSAARWCLTRPSIWRELSQYRRWKVRALSFGRMRS